MGVDAQNSLSPRKGAAARNPGGRQPASRLSPLLTSLPGQAKAGFTWAGISHPRASVGQPAALDEKSGVVTDTELWERRLQEAPWRAGSHRASALLGRESVSSDVTRPLGHQVKHILPDTLHLPASLSFSSV